MPRATEKIIDFSKYRYLHIDVHDGVAEVVVKRPDYDARGHWEVCDVFRELDQDTRIRAVLLYWADPPMEYDSLYDVFPGFDLDPGERFALYTQGFKEAREGVYNLLNSVKPVVSVFRGHTPTGAALAAAILADISVAEENAQICDDHVALGIPAGDHAVLWVAHIGVQRAKRLLLASDPVTGAEAASMGLVSLAVPDGEALDRGREYARKLADRPRNAVRLTKRAINQYLKQAAITSFDISMVMEHLGLLDGDLDAVVKSGAGPEAAGDGSTHGGASGVVLPSDRWGDRSHAE